MLALLLGFVLRVEARTDEAWAGASGAMQPLPSRSLPFADEVAACKDAAFDLAHSQTALLGHMSASSRYDLRKRPKTAAPILSSDPDKVWVEISIESFSRIDPWLQEITIKSVVILFVVAVA